MKFRFLSVAAAALMFAACNEPLNDAAEVEDIAQKASAGLDIGGVMIGMHVHPVVVPIRLENRHIGKAFVLAARHRPKYVGGERAVYNTELE